MPLRAIVFDFDGVIADSEPLHYRAFRDVLAPLGITLTERDYYARYLGFDDVGVFERIAEDAGQVWIRERFVALGAEKAHLMEALESDGSILFPGAADAVRRAAADVPLAIASGALRVEIERVLAREDLRRFFSAIVAAEDAAETKPAADPYLRAVKELSRAVGAAIDPSECAAIEDSKWGLQSARAAGLRTVAVAHSYDASALVPADLTIRSINDLDLRSLAALFLE
jgi:beta-phosphoglucomutase-like phosphatase (HAD superfamily)